MADQRQIPCIVDDMSQWGVRLKLVGADRVPDQFVLKVDATEKVIGCETVWRNDDEIGALTDLME